MKRFRRSALTALSMIAGTTAAGAASAQTYCGSAPGGGWNAPNGAIVFEVGTPNKDVILGVIEALGETRSHTMLSHGASGWALHNTLNTTPEMLNPNVFQTCKQPLTASMLQYGQPGARDVTQGGMYEFLYGGSDPATSLTYQQSVAWSLTPLGYLPLVTPAGANVLNWEWDNVAYTTPTDNGNPMFQLMNDSGQPLVYSLHQFLNSGGVPNGNSTIGASGDLNGGTVCSTLAAYLEAKSGYTPTTPFSYTNRAQVEQAAENLFNGIIQSVVDDGTDDFVTSCLANSCPFFPGCTAAIAPLLPPDIAPAFATFGGCCNFDGGQALRANMASQVANCMGSNQCADNNQADWEWVADYETPTSITPDRMAGVGPNHVGASIWAWDVANPVQWNAGGNVYGCWD